MISETVTPSWVARLSASALKVGIQSDRLDNLGVAAERSAAAATPLAGERAGLEALHGLIGHPLDQVRAPTWAGPSDRAHSERRVGVGDFDTGGHGSGRAGGGSGG